MLCVHSFDDNFVDNLVFSLFLLVKNNEDRKMKKEDETIMWV